MKLCPHTNRELQRWKESPDYLIEPKLKILYYLKWSPLKYENNYFLEEYKNTYGKTYYEDEKHIRLLAKKRIEFLKPFLKNHSSILELGCATGFFLDEARSLFKKLKGIEISQFATDYAKEKLMLDVECMNIFDFFRKNTTKYDVVASFYVIEHFKEQREIFSSIRDVLNYKGLWVCAIPSTFGPLFIYDKKKWIESHPKDHYVDFNPYALKRILSLYGFRLLSIRPASYHQERTKGMIKKIPAFLYKYFADIFCFGDTIEFIAQKY